MSLLSAVAVYFVIWWLALFIVLPFGVRSQAEEGDVTLGTDHGAPHQPFLLRRLLATTILAGLIFAAIYVAIAYFGIGLEDLMI